MTWDKEIINFERYLQYDKKFSANTISAYLRDIIKFKSFCESELAHIKPSDITEDHIQEYLLILSKQHLSERSQIRWISAVKCFFTYLQDHNIRADNPAQSLKSPKLGLYLTDTLTTDEIERIMASIDIRSNTGKRDLFIVEVLYLCGLRISELITVKFSDVNFTELYLNVVEKGGKSRHVPLTSYTCAVILYYINHNRANYKIIKSCQDLLLLSHRGFALTKSDVIRIINNFAQSASIKGKVSAETLRNSFVTHLLQNGADLKDIEEILGQNQTVESAVKDLKRTDNLRQVILDFHPLRRGS